MTEAETRFFATLITGFFWCRQSDEAKPHAARPRGGFGISSTTFATSAWIVT